MGSSRRWTASSILAQLDSSTRESCSTNEERGHFKWNGMSFPFEM